MMSLLAYVSSAVTAESANLSSIFADIFLMQYIERMRIVAGLWQIGQHETQESCMRLVIMHRVKGILAAQPLCL